MNARDLLPGFQDLVHDSQTTFRVLLAALSEPGTVRAMPVTVTGPDPLDAAMTAVVLTLADLDTPVWLDIDDESTAQRVLRYLSFHCGCKVVDTPMTAAFALVTRPEQLLLAGFAQGSMDYPDHATMLLVQVASLTDGPQRILSGPGIASQQVLHVAGLPASFDEQWRANGAVFPTGVDLVFCCGDRIIGLPRTTRIDASNIPAEAIQCMSQ